MNLLRLAPCLLLSATVCATLHAQTSTSAAPAIPSPTTAPTPSASAPATEAALPALDTPEAAVHELLVAMFTGDQKRLERATIEVPGREILTQGQKVPPGMFSQVDKVIDGLHLQRLKIGDSIKVKTNVSPEGITVVMDENHINEKRTEITGPNMPFPFILVRDGKEWKVDPTPLIASRKDALAAREKAAAQTTPAATKP